MEKGVPSSSARLQAIKNLARAGIHVTLRLRPFIIGVSSDSFQRAFLRKAGMPPTAYRRQQQSSYLQATEPPSPAEAIGKKHAKKS